MKYLYLLTAILFCAVHISAQVVLTPIPGVTESFRLDDVWRLTALVSGNGPVTGNLTAHIEDNSHNLVYEATLPGITLRPGVNNIQQTKIGGGATSFGQGQSATLLRQTGTLPYGEFIICYFLNDINTSAITGEYCYEKSVKPMLPPELLQPYDNEEIATRSPLLVWKAPFPVSQALTYALRLTEVQKGQSAAEAIEKNAPIISRQYRDQTQLLYPGDVPALEDGKTYAWRISVSAGDYNLGTTDVWQFTVKEEKIRPRNDSYRILDDKPDGNVYVIKDGILRVAYDNRYSMDTLNYSIKPLTKATNMRISNLPAQAMSRGMNKMEIDLRNNTAMEEGKKYLFQIHQKNGNDQYLEFIYRKGR